MPGARRFRPIFAVAALMLVGSFAQAHHTAGGADAPETLLSIPGLLHGQMIGIANHRAEILDLADKQAPTDPAMRRLQGPVRLSKGAYALGCAAL